jgi:hypothetical protein
VLLCLDRALHVQQQQQHGLPVQIMHQVDERPCRCFPVCCATLSAGNICS